MNFNWLLAARTSGMGASVIREALKVVSRPDMISLAGGIPAPECFPLDLMDELTSVVLRKYGASSLQYGPTEGFPPLREALVEHLARSDIGARPEDIITTTGSQGALDTLGKILISKGDKIAVEAPTYLTALSAFNPYEPTYLNIETDGDGVIPEALDRLLEENDVKFIYLVPTFQNPTGRTIPLDRRKKIADAVMRRNVLLIEDDPYSALRYRGNPVPPIKTLAPDNVVYLSTLSKVLAPGLRLGFCVAPPLIRKWMVLAKQGTDLHTSSFDQALATEYLLAGHLERHLPRILSVYKPRQEAMLNALTRHFPDSFQWSQPEGGMFIWAEGPTGLDTAGLYQPAVERGVVFVPGMYFYATPGEGVSAMRLNYTMTDPATTERGIRILADVMSDALAERGSAAATA